MIEFIIDSRETKLFNLCKERDLDKYQNKIIFDTKQLDIGDIHIVSEVQTWIIERKTVSDLLSSIKDGRYKEQKCRLLASGFNITYIIEGDDMLCNKNKGHQDILHSIYLYSMYRDSIHLIFTKSMEDTCTLLLSWGVKVLEKPEKFVKTSESVDESAYLKHVKMKKIDNITPENCFIMQLSQIPSISYTIAKNIQNKYSSMVQFIEALKESKEKIQLLCSIDKIGKEKAKKILQFMEFTE